MLAPGSLLSTLVPGRSQSGRASLSWVAASIAGTPSVPHLLAPNPNPTQSPQVYPRTFLGDTSMYDKGWWQLLVKAWEVVVFNRGGSRAGARLRPGAAGCRQHGGPPWLCAWSATKPAPPIGPLPLPHASLQ